MDSKRTALAAVLVLVGGLALTGCGGGKEAGSTTAAAAAGGDACGQLKETTTATVATNPGAQDLVIKTVKDQGFDKKYDLNLDVKSFLNPPATAQAITQHAVDLG